MQFLRLMGVSSDGSALILVGTEGAQFRLPVDEGLRSAVRASRVSTSTSPQSAALGLPPREIQARLRAGSSAEDVARDAGAPVEKIRRYEVPILAERTHTATRAQQALLRRPAAGMPTGGGASQLGDIVATRAEEEGFETESVGWDAWRREDGRWTVQVTVPWEPTTPAVWTFDPPARAVVPANDAARELLVEQPARPAPVSARVHSLDAAREEQQPARPVEAAGKPEEIVLPDRQAVGESRRSARRPMVPAWDDILLGARRGD